MSHIIEFTIDGLAGRSKPFSHKLDRHTNVFFGLNGCGKTSLLKILHSAMQNDSTLLTRVPFKSASVTIYSLTFDTNFIRKIENKKFHGIKLDLDLEDAQNDESGVILDEDTKDEPMRWQTSPENEQAMRTRWAHQYLPTSRIMLVPKGITGSKVYGITNTSLMSEEQLDNVFADTIKRLWTNYTTSLLSQIRTAQETGLASILRVVLTPPKPTSRIGKLELETHQAYLRMKQFVSRQNSVDLISNEEAFKKRYDEDILLRRVVQDINKTEQEIEEYSKPRNRLEGLVKELLSANKEVTFSDRSIDIKTKDGSVIGIASLSSGEKHVLRLLVETLQAGVSTIMVDEPELSLHIDWQKNLVNMMKMLSPNAQIILATHSPEVMAEIPDKFITRM